MLNCCAVHIHVAIVRIRHGMDGDASLAHKARGSMSGVSHRLQDFTLLFIIATTIGTVLRGFFKQLVIVLAHDLTQHASLDVVSHALRKMVHF